MHDLCTDGDSCHSTTGPTLLPQPPKTLIYVCQVWMHYEDHSVAALDLIATGEVTRREVPEVRKAVWTAAAKRAN